MKWLIIVAVVLWTILGDPKKDLANAFWSNSAAPWEGVTAIYYPSRLDLSKYQSKEVGDLEQCRDWVYAQAARRNDPNLVVGDYECGIGFLRMYGGLKVYRTSVR